MGDNRRDDHINRTMFETTHEDRGKVVTHVPKDGIPGSGFAALLIAGKCPNGEKEILELRFRSSFLKHINTLKTALEELNKTEEEQREAVIEKAQELVYSDPDEETNSVSPTKEERVPRTKMRFHRESSFHSQMRNALSEFFKYFAVEMEEDETEEDGVDG